MTTSQHDWNHAHAYVQVSVGRKSSNLLYSDAMERVGMVLIALSTGSSLGTGSCNVAGRAWSETAVTKIILSNELVSFFQCVTHVYVTVFEVVCRLTCRTRL